MGTYQWIQVSLSYFHALCHIGYIPTVPRVWPVAIPFPNKWAVIGAAMFFFQYLFILFLARRQKSEFAIPAQRKKRHQPDK